MKTLREILLTRHQAVEPKLDAIRRLVVDELNNQKTKEQTRPVFFVSWCVGCSNQFWLELIWPCRRIWTGLAVVWIFLLLVNFSQRDHGSRVTTKAGHSGEVIMSLQAQPRWINELLADRQAPADADRPRNLVPRPRTAISETVRV